MARCTFRPARRPVNRELYLTRKARLARAAALSHMPAVVLAEDAALLVDVVRGGKWAHAWWALRRAAEETADDLWWRTRVFWHRRVMRRSRDEAGTRLFPELTYDDLFGDEDDDEVSA